MPEPEPEREGLALGDVARLVRGPRTLLGTWRELDVKALGRVLWHAILVGAAAGLLASAFYWALSWSEWFLLEELAHHPVLRPLGESSLPPEASDGPTRWWLVALLPALGGLGCGLLVYFFCRDAAGPGGDKYIEAFHQQRGLIPWKVPIVKGLASLVTLATGGAVGREGPTMQMASGVGSGLARRLKLSDRERRILVVAGASAATGAIFQTPLGAALYGVELLYRDDFESEALIPSILASVTGYSIFTTIHGQGHLLATAHSYSFDARALPLYAIMAVGLSLFGLVFVKVRHGAQDEVFAPLRLPMWAKPALGGALLGVTALFVPQVLGAGYGLVQGAILHADWIQPGAWGALTLLGIAAMRIVGTSFSLGSGASGGEFGPTLVIGGLVGGAFGILFHVAMPDVVPDAGAFALVGMGAMIGGIAHVPISSLIMVCELAGSYDLLVPLMLAEGITFLLLRHVSLYREQLPNRLSSPAHRHEHGRDVLESIEVGEVFERGVSLLAVHPDSSVDRVLWKLGLSSRPAILVQEGDSHAVGLISLETVQAILAEPELRDVVVAADVMVPLARLTPADNLHDALHAFLETKSHALPVLDGTGDKEHVVGVITQDAVTEAYERAVEERLSLAPAE
jgi:CIC family chloride channel protein